MWFTVATDNMSFLISYTINFMHLFIKEIQSLDRTNNIDRAIKSKHQKVECLMLTHLFPEQFLIIFIQEVYVCDRIKGR